MTNKINETNKQTSFLHRQILVELHPVSLVSFHSRPKLKMDEFSFLIIYHPSFMVCWFTLALEMGFLIRVVWFLI
jgi:hypothetical protein